MELFIIWISLVCANFCFQLIKQERNWVEAIERSYFQGIAILAVGLFT